MSWPPLPLEPWRDTRDTLQMWMQIAGKICLARTPRVNHFWNIAFQITPRGLTTPAMPHAGRTFTLAFDFIAHELAIDTSDEARTAIPLRPQTVADFYRTLTDTLRAMDLDTRIWTMPVEFPEGLKTTPMQPAAAYYSTEMSIFVLPYEAVRTSATPEDDLRAFLRATYDAAATLGRWDRSSLERAAAAKAPAPEPR